MVRVATSFVAVVIALSSVLVSAAPTKRQDIPVAVPDAGGAASSDGGLNQIDLNGVDTADPNGSLGGTVDIPSSTSSTETLVPTTETVVPPPPAETVPVPPPVETPPPPQYTPETVPPSAHQTYPQYGSGSVNWHVDYNSCIQTCVETHPTPGSVVTIPAEPPSSGGEAASPPPASGGSASNTNVTPTGTVIEILVEPSNGVFHVVPAFVPAAIGDTIRWTVVNNQHNIIQSSVILPCNATAGGFTSGPISAGQTFTHVVDTLEPTFFFVEGKCQEGMFGAINPPTGAPESTTTVGALMPNWTDANPDLKAALQATELIAAQTPGMTWGNKFDVKDVPSELYTQVASNVIFTRGVIGQNMEMVGTDGVFRPKGTLIIPADVSTFLTVADQGGYPAEPQPQAPVAAPSPDVANANVAAAGSDYDTGAALSIVSPRVAVAGVAILAAFFVL